MTTGYSVNGYKREVVQLLTSKTPPDVLLGNFTEHQIYLMVIGFAAVETRIAVMQELLDEGYIVQVGAIVFRRGDRCLLTTDEVIRSIKDRIAAFEGDTDLQKAIGKLKEINDAQ